MSRRHHHAGREPRTETVKLTPQGESLLDALEVEIRAQAAYELAEATAVDELNRAPGYIPLGCPPVRPTPWAATDPETRRDYRLHVVETMHRAEQLRGDRAAKGML